MQEYSENFKRKMVQRMSGPHRRSATSLAKETGVAQATLSRWLISARTIGLMSKKDDRDGQKPDLLHKQRSAEDKMRLVLEANRGDDDAVLRAADARSLRLEVRAREPEVVGAPPSYAAACVVERATLAAVRTPTTVFATGPQPHDQRAVLIPSHGFHHHALDTEGAQQHPPAAHSATWLPSTLDKPKRARNAECALMFWPADAARRRERGAWGGARRGERQ